MSLLVSDYDPRLGHNIISVTDRRQTDRQTDDNDAKNALELSASKNPL